MCESCREKQEAAGQNPAGDALTPNESDAVIDMLREAETLNNAARGEAIRADDGIEGVLARIISEADELQKRVSKLAAFVGTESFTKLSPANRILLERQLKAMKEYRDILDARIELTALWKEADEKIRAELAGRDNDGSDTKGL